MKVPSISVCLSTICIRLDALPQLGTDVLVHVEPLPFSVEGEPWALLKPLHRLTGIDAATSVSFSVPGVVPPGSVLLLRYEWINAIDTLAEQALTFNTHPEGSVTWVTDEFVRRVKAAGLEGLRFVHKGYLVRDLSQARLRPAPKLRVSSNARRPDPAIVVDMDAEWLAQRDHARSLAALALPTVASATADAGLALLDDWFEQGRRVWTSLDNPERAMRVEVAVAVFGDLLCRALGWQWAMLRRGDDAPCLAVVTADRACAVPLHRFAQRQFVLKERTLRLLFNMLRAGQLPAPPAKGAALIG